MFVFNRNKFPNPTNERKLYQSVRVRSLAKRMNNEWTNERKFICSFNVLYAKRCVHKLRKKNEEKIEANREHFSFNLLMCSPKTAIVTIRMYVREIEFTICVDNFNGFHYILFNVSCCWCLQWWCCCCCWPNVGCAFKILHAKKSYLRCKICEHDQTRKSS